MEITTKLVLENLRRITGNLSLQDYDIIDWNPTRSIVEYPILRFHRKQESIEYIPDLDLWVSYRTV